MKFTLKGFVKIPCSLTFEAKDEEDAKHILRSIEHLPYAGSCRVVGWKFDKPDRYVTVTSMEEAKPGPEKDTDELDHGQYSLMGEFYHMLGTKGDRNEET